MTSDAIWGRIVYSEIYDFLSVCDVIWLNIINGIAPYMEVSMHKVKVLIVDDSRSMRQVLSGCITQMGFQNIKTLSNGDKAVELFKSQTADLLFLVVPVPPIMLNKHLR